MTTANQSQPAPRKFNRGVVFGEDVLDYLAHLERNLGCSRSRLINEIIRQHAIRSGGAEPVAPLEGIATPVIRM